MKIFASVADLIGQTPLVDMSFISPGSRILGKLEYLNPAGSVKDRVAREILNTAEREGKLKRGSTVIEPTSGNTGIGLAALCAARGYNFIAVLPESMSLERRKLLAAYGARIELTPASQGMSGALARADELKHELPDAIIAGQFVNTANPQAHYRTTGPEIWQDTDGQIDIFVAGVGSGGSITGVGHYLKEQNPKISIVAVEPKGSPVLSGGKPGKHQIQGIGAGFVPKVLDKAIYDEVIAVADDLARDMCRRVARHGLLLGVSSGAALCAAVKLANRPENSGKMIVTLLPDGGERYLSTDLFAGGEDVD